jgi:SSS family solute:Na+ symporter
MEVTTMHLIGIIFTIIASTSFAIWSARKIKSADGFSLAGRSASPMMVAGSIAGVIIGGGATVGTAQMAFQVGLSGWAYALGAGIAYFIQGRFYARPLRATGLETVPQFFEMHYGKATATAVNFCATMSILISQVSGTIAAVTIITLVMNIPHEISTVIFTILVVATVFSSGQRGNSITGIVKMCILWGALIVGGGMAISSFVTMPNFSAVFPADPWFNLFGRGFGTVTSNIFSMVVGILCAQAYIQALYSASNAETAARGAYTAAAVIIPIGLPIIAIGMFMKANHPDLTPILALPAFFLTYFPDVLGGVAIAGILLAIIGSNAGLALGIGTLISRDLIASIFNVTDDKKIIKANRIAIVLTTICSSVISYINLNAIILEWNFMAMILRGAGIFVPLTLAIFKPGLLPPKWALASIIISTGAAGCSKFVFNFSPDPLYLALVLSASIITIGIMTKKD